MTIITSTIMTMITTTVMTMTTITMAGSSTTTTRKCNRFRSKATSRSTRTNFFLGWRIWCRRKARIFCARKGILSFKDDDERFVFQGVHMILDGDHQRPWKEDEKRQSRIVFIGRNLPEKMITEGFESCIA